MATADPIVPRCTAHSKQSGEQCRQRPIPGSTVCHFHGGGAPQVRNAAIERILAMVDPALVGLVKLVKEARSEDVRLRAIQDVLDRAGLEAKKLLEIKQQGSQPMVIQQVILNALSDFPEARSRLASKLLELDKAQSDQETPKTNGHAADVVDLKPESE